ncbi:hypothetical protein ACFX13_042937 [Malus domestica]|uniref:RRM domain-containing protein n=1 Tax=Malus domestica TaxID=3750 RepID=A0A498JN65_MALDO|nr:probable RNA-binding protein ARP1 [Malus domestica]XP_050155965.1 probable RNA-binding protein ARP1 [Malus sylvestris]RXH95294.1 hypothetical protein DVH24_024978 [Malus domestica]
MIKVGANGYSGKQFGDTTKTKIFVGGLPWETRVGTMRRYFEQFGEILEAVVITDKFTARSKGYGFVTFKDPESAMRACENPNPIIDGRRANCNLAVLGAQKNRPTTPQPQHEVVEGMKKTRSSSIPFINTYFHHYNPQYALIPYSTYGYPIYQQDNNVALMNYNYTGYGGWGQQQHYYPYPGVYYYPCVPVQAQPGHNSPTTSNPRPKLQSLPLALPTTTVTGTYSNFGLYSN